jgi:hypothetical protein
LRQAHLLWSALGMLFVLYLVYAEIVALHSLCEWCTVVHLLTFATFLLALNRWQQRGLPAPTLSPVVSSRSGSVPSSANGTARQPQSASNGARRSAGGSSGKSGQRTRR